ncbi:unnamed protein product, partial [Didymodactylos carnosus]
INESTGHSPAFLMYGRELKLPLDLMYGPETDVLDELKSSEEVRAYTERLKAIIASAHQSVRENLEIAQQGQKFLYDRHRQIAPELGGGILLPEYSGNYSSVHRTIRYCKTCQIN